MCLLEDGNRMCGLSSYGDLRWIITLVALDAATGTDGHFPLYSIFTDHDALQSMHASPALAINP